ncbi:uncharacterized protein LOC132045858 [Lycium ferocissimum]|uniref:uncharacterized protein LOC132045858 n=1 Tax=Lycium ferocissimum TaxID=112874 RepID=UPI0028157EC8|nr:uncharacterized protein LOC132045858 [Lycium ferocissimum]
MERIETQESEDDSQPIDAHASVMGPDHPGRVRLYGHKVTKTLLKQKAGDSGSSSNITDEVQAKMEQMEERMQQCMHEKSNAQMDTMLQGITMRVIAQLQRLNPDLRLDPSMLRFSVRSSGEASSSPQAVMQRINCPSASSNIKIAGNFVVLFHLSDLLLLKKHKPPTKNYENQLCISSCQHMLCICTVAVTVIDVIVSTKYHQVYVPSLIPWCTLQLLLFNILCSFTAVGSLSVVACQKIGIETIIKYLALSAT